MEIESLTLAGLAAVGVVNVITFFRPTIASELKFALSAVSAFLVVMFVPVEIGNVIAERAKEALVIAFAMSGTYKLASRAGGLN